MDHSVFPPIKHPESFALALETIKVLKNVLKFYFIQDLINKSDLINPFLSTPYHY